MLGKFGVFVREKWEDREAYYLEGTNSTECLF